MIDLMDLEVNIPSTNFGTYTTLLAAPPKFGKTEFCTYFDKPFIIDFEAGSSGKVVYRVGVSKWSEVKKYVKQLTSNPKLKEKFTTVCIDTVNYAIDACKQYIIDQAHAQAEGKKVIDTFNKVGFDKYELLKKEFTSVFNKLKLAGYGLVMVAHTKEKLIDRDKETERYSLMPDLNNPELNMISGMADFYLVGENEVTILEAPERDDDGKVLKPAVTTSKRIMYLRKSENAEGGFRWKYKVPEKIDFSFEAFKQVFDEAVAEEISVGKKKFGLTDEKAEEIGKTLEEDKEKKEKEVFEEDKKEETENKRLELVNEIKGIATKIHTADSEKITEIKEILEDKDPIDIMDVKKLEKMLKDIKKLEKSTIKK